TDRTEHLATSDELPLPDDTYRVLTTVISTADGPAVLHVAESTDDLDDAVRLLATALIIAIPAIVLVLAGVMWWLTGRTLRPVDDIRAEVDAIGDADSQQRLQGPHRDDEIGRLAGTMNRMLDRLHDASDRQRRFVADAAHELRTPLTRIRTNLDVDLGRPEAADFEATAHEVRREAIDLQRLIDDLLHLARSDAGQAVRHRQPVDLDDIVMDEIREQRAATPDVAIDAGSVSAASLDGNPDHLARAIRNLLTNGAQHAGSKVVVELRETDRGVYLAVTDDGPGVPPEHRSRIFERFARVDDARTRSDGGTGLGLAITRDIVEAHGGAIRYDAGHASGARFVIELPRSGPVSPT
ncbi:MAG: sensor histidine kinase, partial [Acidimicrobiales bacterium]